MDRSLVDSGSYKCSNPSRTKQTTQAYLSRAKTIVAKIALSNGDTEIDAITIAEWFIDVSANLAPATIRVYRSSLVAYIEEQVAVGLFDPDVAKRAITVISKARSGKNTRQHTSALKAKSITKEKILLLNTRLSKKSSVFAVTAALMFSGSLVAGLRPSEWFDAAAPTLYENGDILLQVKNAKATNGRSFGAIREMVIPAGTLSQVVLSLLENLKVLQSRGYSRDHIYQRCRRIINGCNVKSGGKNVTLYTARHQFAANMKNVIAQDDLALLMGHNTIETQKSSYGKRRNGHPEFRVTNETTEAPYPAV